MGGGININEVLIIKEGGPNINGGALIINGGGAELIGGF